VWRLPLDSRGHVSLAHLLARLKDEQITSLMVEGGAELNFSLLADGLVDELWLFMAPMLLGGRSAPAFVGGEGFGALQNSPRFPKMEIRRLDQDLLIMARR
jgi:riboflavin-specific deaminase-like protein